MQVLLEMPEDIVEALQNNWGNLSLHAIETIAAEGYRTGALSGTQIRRLLGYSSRILVHSLLKSHGVPYRYSESDLQSDLQAHQDLGLLRNGYDNSN